MNRHKTIPALTLAVWLLAALACNSNNPAGIPPATSAAQTVSALLTASAPATLAAATTQAPAYTAAPSATPSASPVAQVEPTAEVKPSDTPAPTNTSGPQGCADSAQYVADITVPDNTVFAAGAPFTKTWRLRNAGTCTWVGSYNFVFISGDAMGGPPAVPITGNVAPGSQYDVSVNLVAPAGPGTYKGTWQMRNAGGAFFGTRPFVQIVVAAGSPTVTLTQGSPAGPSATFTPTPTATNTLPAPAQLTWPTVQQGNSGPNVYAVQYLLRHRGDGLAADGIFGPQTKVSVQAFQASQALTADGIVGPQTWPKLIVTVQQGSNGEAVRAVQYLLRHKHGHNEVNVDGIFGPVTDAAIEDFQADHGLTVDGIVGPQTWSALVSN
jgi:peptidoglycan hydrolase-like protein with peptidoglycan-binding domain